MRQWNTLTKDEKLRYVMKARKGRQRGRAPDGRWAHLGTALPFDVDNLMGTDLGIGARTKSKSL